MNGLPSNVSDDISPSELPDGFTPADPSGHAAAPRAGGGGNDAAAARTAQRQSVLEQSMTSDALARLRRVKLVKPERVAGVEAMIENMALNGKLQTKVSESKLIEMLEGIVGAQARKAGKDAGKISIQRKKYAFDSDDDDDDDDLY